MKPSPLNLHRFFGDLTPIVPYAPLFFVQRGLSLAQVSFLFLVWSVSVAIFELPTGILADYVPRRTSLIISKLAKLSCFIIWLFSPTFYGFLIGFIFWGLGSAIDSGAFQAYVYENSESFPTIYGSAIGWGFFGLFFSGLVGSLFFKQGFHMLTLLSIASLTLSAFFVLLIPEKKLSVESNAISWKFPPLRPFLTNRNLVILLLIGIVAGGIKGSLEEYNSLLLQAKNIPLVAVGFILASLELWKSAGSWLAGKIAVSDIGQMGFLLAIGLMLMGIGIFPGIVALVFFALLTLSDAVLWVHNDHSIQSHAIRSNRATLASVKNLGTQFISILIFGGIALLGDGFSIETIYFWGGVVLFVMGIGFLVNFFLKPHASRPSFFT